MNWAKDKCLQSYLSDLRSRIIALEEVNQYTQTLLAKLSDRIFDAEQHLEQLPIVVNAISDTRIDNEWPYDAVKTTKVPDEWIDRADPVEYSPQNNLDRALDEVVHERCARLINALKEGK